MRPITFTLSLLALLALLPSSPGQQQLPTGKDRNKQNPLQPDSGEVEERMNFDCDSEFRAFFNGVCTAGGSRARKLLGSTNRAQFTYFAGRSTTTPAGAGLRSAREISNMLFKTTRPMFDARRLNEMATFFGQFIDHTIVATPINSDGEELPIPVPSTDPLFGNHTELPFSRSARVRVRKGSSEERPQNSLTSAIDLVSVYGPSKKRNTALRPNDIGFMSTSKGDLPPLNLKQLNNAPRSTGKLGKKFFACGDHRCNEHPVLTALHVLFLREHNDLVRELKRTFPSFSNRIIFETARKINGAQMQKIVFNDWYPALTGTPLPEYKGFKKNVDPTVSVLFSTAAFRVGHTLVGNQVNRAGENKNNLSPIPFTDMFFNTARFIKKSGIEVFLRGASCNRAQKIDLQVSEALRNFLFTNVKGDEEGIDLVALNIQRGRDHNLPTYNQIRQKFRGNKASSFAGITSNPNIRSALQNAYDNVNRVEAWPGLLAEDLAPGSSMGLTMLKIWEREFTRLRDGDSFYYEVDGLFDPNVMAEIQRVKDLFSSDVDTFKAIVLRNSNIKDKDLPRRSFFIN